MESLKAGLVVEVVEYSNRQADLVLAAKTMKLLDFQPRGSNSDFFDPHS